MASASDGEFISDIRQPKVVTLPSRVEEFLIRGRKFRIQVPNDPERILADAAAGKSLDPYWAKVWDAAPKSAACMLQTQWPDGISVLEIGCGCGLLGIAALAAGCNVTLSDHDPQAVAMALHNVRINGFANAATLVMDWNNPPVAQFDLLLASDVLYEEQFHRPLLSACKSLIADGGSLRIGDPGRRLAASFLQLALHDRWSVEIFDEQLKPVLMPSINQFQWFVLER